MATELDAVAARFEQSWRNHRQFEVKTLEAPASAAVAYQVQDRVFAARFPGMRATAWKAGAASPEAEPTSAPIGAVFASPAVLPAADFHMYCIESEVAFRMCRDLPSRPQEWSEADLADAVGEVLVTIELCDTRLANWKAAPAVWRLADFQMNGALVTGSGTTDWRRIDFASQPVELWLNGERKISKAGSHPMGTPLRVLPWIARHCAERSGGLRAGDIVTTGSWTGMEFIAPGDSVTARFPGIGEAALKIG